MTEYGKAAVLVGPRKIEIKEFPLPSEIPDDCILAKLEMCGVCGTDVHLYKGRFSNYPSILGHETIGRIVKLGAKAAET
ncbi:MAG TPA: alcohol dehydrogenase catalytic domain-containing protein [Synergistaceae bacterium]|nr:alcohol dehydrogenase catalytic domain-containing protein [Synergistaceae bacterium]